MMLRQFCRKISQDAASVKPILARIELFEREQQRQRNLYSSPVDKINVKCYVYNRSVEMVMNKNVSTPAEVARGMQESVTNSAILALVDGVQTDMNQPLSSDCEIKFIDFKSKFSHACNMALWRSCAFFTSWIFKHCVHCDFRIDMCSFARPVLHSGSFVCDIKISYQGDDQFDPQLVSKVNLRSLSYAANKMIYENHAFRPLTMSLDGASAIFEDCPLKLRQLPQISSDAMKRTGSGDVRIYRMNTHIDLSWGPMIPNTRVIGRYAVTALYPIETRDYGRLYRVQGVAIPRMLPTTDHTFRTIMNAAACPNLYAPFPSLSTQSVLPGDDSAEKPQLQYFNDNV